MFRSGGGGGGRNEEDDDVLMQQAQQQEGDGNMSDDDNAAPEMQSEAEADSEDPLLLAMDDLEGRVVAALDDVKMHPGVKSAPNSNVHEELATLLRPVLEVAAHTAPSVARTYYQGVGPEGIEASCEDVYQRVVSDLVLPVLLEMAQSDTNPAKRGASLEFFRNLYKEWHKAGSWLDATTQGALEGPYGSGSHSHRSSAASNLAQTPAARAQQKRRQTKKLARESELLRYWVQASIACTLPGAFTSDASEGAVAARGVIAASASLRPSLKLISQRIRDADDRGANKLFVPVMTMVQGVLKKLFVNSNSATESDAVRSSCIKFLEIVCLCCSAKPQDSSQRRRGTAVSILMRPHQDILFSVEK
jgi:symplekin